MDRCDFLDFGFPRNGATRDWTVKTLRQSSRTATCRCPSESRLLVLGRMIRNSFVFSVPTLSVELLRSLDQNHIRFSLLTETGGDRTPGAQSNMETRATGSVKRWLSRLASYRTEAAHLLRGGHLRISVAVR